MSARQVHLFFPYHAGLGGSQMRALEIAKGLRERHGAEVGLWATSSRLPASLRKQHGVRWFAPWKGFDTRLKSSSFVFIGSFWKPKAWLRRVRPKQLTIIVNDMNVANLRAHLPLYREMHAQPQIAFTSHTQRRLFDGESLGGVHVSPIDLERFSPAADKPMQAGRLKLGRHSRDTLDKHQFLYDPELYAMLAAEDIDIDLMGASCIEHLLPKSMNIHLRPAGSIDAADYLRSLDCFIYRTGTFYDTAARAVREAMACGLPVVCHRFGGHVENIVHGENGFVFDDQQQAIEIVRRLRDDLELRRRIGANARATMEALFAPGKLDAMYASYLGGDAVGNVGRASNESVLSRVA